PGVRQRSRRLRIDRIPVPVLTRLRTPQPSHSIHQESNQSDIGTVNATCRPHGSNFNSPAVKYRSPVGFANVNDCENGPAVSCVVFTPDESAPTSIDRCTIAHTIDRSTDARCACPVVSASSTSLAV